MKKSTIFILLSAIGVGAAVYTGVAWIAPEFSAENSPFKNNPDLANSADVNMQRALKKLTKVNDKDVYAVMAGEQARANLASYAGDVRVVFSVEINENGMESDIEVLQEACNTNEFLSTDWSIFSAGIPKLGFNRTKEFCLKALPASPGELEPIELVGNWTAVKDLTPYTSSVYRLAYTDKFGSPSLLVAGTAVSCKPAPPVATKSGPSVSAENENEDEDTENVEDDESDEDGEDFVAEPAPVARDCVFSMSAHKSPIGALPVVSLTKKLSAVFIPDNENSLFPRFMQTPGYLSPGEKQLQVLLKEQALLEKEAAIEEPPVEQQEEQEQEEDSASVPPPPEPDQAPYWRWR